MNSIEPVFMDKGGIMNLLDTSFMSAHPDLLCTDLGKARLLQCWRALASSLKRASGPRVVWHSHKERLY